MSIRVFFFLDFVCSVYMDSVILLSVLPFSDGLNLLKQVHASVIFLLFVMERFTLGLSGGFKLTQVWNQQ